MAQVNVLEAKSNLSKIIRQLELGQEERVVIARNGRPVAQITLLDEVPASKRIGVAERGSLVEEGWDIDECNDEVLAMFEVV